MFGTIRKHQQWVWVPVVAITSIGMVWFFTNSSSMGDANAPDRPYIMSGTTNGKPPTINGRPITISQFRSAHTETVLGHFFRANGKWPESEDKDSLEHDTVIRVFMLQKLKDLDIHVSDEAVARLALERLGTYPLSSLEKEHLAPHGVTLADFDRFMRNEAAIQQLVGVVTTSAKLIKPQEAEILYRKEKEEVATELAVFWSSNYLDQVTVTPAAVATYYTNRMPNYRIPERVQVSYVEFVASNYVADADKQLSEITNLNARVDDYYYKQGTNSFKDTNGLPMGETAAKAKIRQEIQTQTELGFARRKASDFGNELYDQPQRERAENLEKLAAAKGLAVKVTPPFDRIGGLDETNFPPEFREKALKLNKESPILFTPIMGENAVYLIALKNRIPSELPAFEKVQEKVTADYKAAQAWDLARTNGNNFATSVTNGLAQKKSFDELCEQAKVKPLALPSFSPSTPSLTNLDERINFYMVQHVAFALKPGEASQFYPLAKQEGGIVLYVKAKLPIDEAKLKTELPEYIGRLRIYRQNEDFNQWFSRQAQPALFIPQRDIPGGPQRRS